MHHQDERRRYPRSRRSISVVQDDSGPGVLNHVDNISVNGILCHTIKPVALMTRMRIQVDLPMEEDHHRIDAEGIVVRCEADEQGDDHFKVAILFTKVSEEDYSAILTVVEEDMTV